MNAASLMDYDVRLRHKNGTIYAVVEELNIWGKGDSADAAMRDLQQRYQARSNDLQEASELGILPPPLTSPHRAIRSTVAGPSVLRDLGLFLVKLTIILACLGLAGALVNKRIVRLIEKKAEVIRTLEGVEVRAIFGRSPTTPAEKP